MPKVSVIVAICNVGPYVAECLESLVNQTLDDIEILAVVVEESSDESYAVTQKYVRQYPERLKMLTILKGTVGDVRNYAMQHASGKFVAFVDGDDCVDVTMMEKMYAKAQLSQSDIVVCGIGRFDNVTGEKSVRAVDESVFPGSILQNPRILKEAAPYICNKLVRLSIIVDNELFFPPGRWFEDVARVYNMLLCAEKIDLVDEPLYQYRVNREGSITQRSDDTAFQIFDALKDFVSFYKAREAFEPCYPAIMRLCRRHLSNRFPPMYKFGKRSDLRKFMHRSYTYMDKNFPEWQTQLSSRFTDNPVDLARTNRRFSFLLSYIPFGYFQYWQRIAANERFQEILTQLLGNRDLRPRERFYHLAKRSKLSERLVFLEAKQDAEIDSSSARLYESLLLAEGGQDLQFIWAAEDEESYKDLRSRYSQNPSTSFAMRGSDEYVEALCRAQTLIFEASIPTYYRKLPKQRVITALDANSSSNILSKKSFAVVQRGKLRKRALLSDLVLIEGEVFSELALRDLLGNYIYTDKRLLELRDSSTKDSPDSTSPNELALDIVNAKQQSFAENSKQRQVHVALHAGAISKKNIKEHKLNQIIDFLLENSFSVSLIVRERPRRSEKVLLQGYNERVEILFDEQGMSTFEQEGRIWNRFIRKSRFPSKRNWGTLNRALQWEYDRRFGSRRFTHFVDLVSDDLPLLALFAAQDDVKRIAVRPADLDELIEREQELHSEDSFELQKAGASKLILDSFYHVVSSNKKRKEKILRKIKKL